MLSDFFQNKRILITGHTGFKGSWLSLWLSSLGAKVCGYALEPNTKLSMWEDVINASGISTPLDFVNVQCPLTKSFSPASGNNFCIKSVIGSILDKDLLQKTFEDFKPEIVFHLAAQPLVRLSYAEPVLTYETNVIGSLNVLEAARKSGSVKAFINITTDKCYENKETGKNFEEDDPFGGWDPYSSSKGCVEVMSQSYRRSFLMGDDGYAMATARAGNVIGGGDWALDRLVPDCVRSINEGRKIEIRNPVAVRPWQHVLEPLSGYMVLAEKLYTEGKKYAEGFNFGSYESSVLTVADVSKKICEYYGKGEVVVHKRDDLHEAKLLMLAIGKAERVLNWKPTLTADEAIKWSVEWYKKFYNKEKMFDYTLQQIKEYQERAGI
ncbi:MAG: CDP-glucose 4,6-dehydratase [Alphaproteobacteria bacterium]|nr:CDP-glucose 4,6-dehydratase [Alphaproteobacteria bacterium]